MQAPGFSLFVMPVSHGVINLDLPVAIELAPQSLAPSPPPGTKAMKPAPHGAIEGAPVSAPPIARAAP